MGFDPSGFVAGLAAGTVFAGRTPEPVRGTCRLGAVLVETAPDGLGAVRIH
jgi:hypothetical protein